MIFGLLNNRSVYLFDLTIDLDPILLTEGGKVGTLRKSFRVRSWSYFVYIGVPISYTVLEFASNTIRRLYRCLAWSMSVTSNWPTRPVETAR